MILILKLDLPETIVNRLVAYILLLISIDTFSQSWLSEIKTKHDFDNLSGLPLSEKYGNVSAIKLVYDIKTKKIYYLNSKYYKYHHEFCSRELNYDVDLNYFNKINYSNDNQRRFLLANINYFETLELFALEISPVDLMSQSNIILLRNLVSKTGQTHLIF